jgi:hypothetical protein
VNSVVRHPTFDRDGYPTDETLQAIRDWPHTDHAGLIEYVREAWSDYGRMWEQDGMLKLATGGWSGNESITSALSGNAIFMALWWESSHRGGLEVFRMPNSAITSTHSEQGQCSARKECRDAIQQKGDLGIRLGDTQRAI